MTKNKSDKENNISLINDACAVIRSNVLLAQSYIRLSRRNRWLSSDIFCFGAD